MALLIGDIGGSSSRWIICAADGCSEELRLPGFNPTQGDPKDLRSALEALPGARPERVVAYGAGCGNATRKAVMQSLLSGIWPDTPIDVGSDLLGSARALFVDRSGITLILGTGMNAGYYDGRELHTPMPSLGYLLGDEGSGADLGKAVLVDALHGRTPPAIREAVFPEGINMDIVATELYRGRSPQAWLAGFARPLLDRVSHPYAEGLVRQRFERMATLLVHYFGDRTNEVRASGSIAVAAKDLLAEVLRSKGFELGVTARSPLPGLARFHAEAAR